MIYKKEVETQIFNEEDGNSIYLVTNQTVKKYFFGILFATEIYNTDEEVKTVVEEKPHKKNSKKIGFTGE